MSDPKKGRIVIPVPYPSWVLTATPGWRDGIAELDKKTVYIVEDCTESVGSTANIPGWMVKASLSDGGHRIWVPQDWVHLEPTSVRQPCNCPLALVLRRGCQDPAHE